MKDIDIVKHCNRCGTELKIKKEVVAYSSTDGRPIYTYIKYCPHVIEWLNWLHADFLHYYNRFSDCGSEISDYSSDY